MLTAKLIDSVAAGNLTTALECLEEGGNPNTLSSDGATAMHIAAGVGVEAVRLMLAYQGDPNVRSVDGSTPLHVAAAWGDKDTLQLLLHNGADPNLVDQEGQRAVDVARNEHHAGCADFLKYYTMLVTIGDEEEPPMYTAEPIETSVSYSVSIQHSTSTHCPGYHSSSDEDDPINLSSQYADALSRRLSQLLHEGTSACLDVTSPTCPFIGDKHDKKGSAHDRTILAEDCCAGLLDSSDSDSEDNESALLLSEGCCNCHCHSHHYIQTEMKDTQHSRSSTTCGCTDLHYCLDMPSLSERCDLMTRYAQNVERRMREKYFPDLDSHICKLDKAGSGGSGNRSLECLCACSHVPHIPSKKGKRSGQSRVRHASSCGHSAKHSGSMLDRAGSVYSINRSLERPSTIVWKIPCQSTKKQNQGGVRSASSVVDASKQSKPKSKPTKKQNQGGVTSASSFVDASKQSKPNSPSENRSPLSQREACQKHREKVVPPTICVLSDSICQTVLPATVIRHRQKPAEQQVPSRPTTNHPRADQQVPGKSHNTSSPDELRSRHNDDCNSPVSSDEGEKTVSFRQQVRSPKGTKSSKSSSKSESSASVMPVLGGPCFPPLNVFNHFGISSPFKEDSLHKRQALLTETADIVKGKEVPIAGSHSSHSVDSGYCEQFNSKLPWGADVSKKYKHLEEMDLGKGLRECSTWYNMPGCPVSSSADKRWRPESNWNDAEFNFQVNGGTYSRHHTGDNENHLVLSESNKSNNPSKLQGGVYAVVSSNLKGGGETQEKFNFQSNARKVLVSLGEQDSPRTTGKQAAKQADITDLSISSTDSFQTCDDASEPDLASDATLENKSVQRTEKICQKRESFGFSVSEMDETQLSPSSLDGWCKKDLSRGHQGDPLKDMESANSRRSTHSAKHSTAKASCDDNPPDKDNRVLSKLPRNQRPLPANASSWQSLHKSWVPPVGSLPDDSNLLTSDESFLASPEQQKPGNPGTTVQSNNVSKWLENLTVTSQGSKLRDCKAGRSTKRTSDQSFLSEASTVQEFVYRDKENGITFIERHIPSICSENSSRSSIESAISLDTDKTVSYDWSDFNITNDLDSSNSSSSFDITAGQTMTSQDTLGNCHKNCLDDEDRDDYDGDEGLDNGGGGDDNDDDDAEDWQGDKENKNNLQKKKEHHMQTKTQKKTSKTSCQQPVNSNNPDHPSSSNDASIPPELASMSDEVLYQSLKDLGEDPGPVLPSTRQTYLQRLASLRSGRRQLALSTSQPGYSSELNRLLSGSLVMEDLANAELAMVAQFQTPDGRTWREGTIKSCFNYLLLDPRVTQNLPLRAKTLSNTEAFKTFLSAVFYIGKGKRSRPYCHLYEAISQLQSPRPKVSKKVQQIMDIWSAGVGVVSLHCFQNVIPVEAYTREACMVDAIGLGRLTNMKRGDYYGVASTWTTTRRRSMGAFLLHKAFHIFLSEGERQICPPDIQRGK